VKVDSRTLSRLERLLDAVPPGRVVTHRVVASALETTGPHVSQLVAAVAAQDTPLPWWRIVADGGAIGRLAHRDAQIAKLTAEGVLVSPAGIVQGLAKHIAGTDTPPAGAPAQAGTGPSRARGMKAKPTSTV
jgi:alkylated DNA nucleotide flippase Atl1